MRKPLPSRADLLEALASFARPVHVRELAARLSVAPASEEALLRVLDNLAYDGTVQVLGGARFALGAKGAAAASRRAPNDNEREGTVSVNARGFGFVATPGHVGDDIFVPAEALGGAMNGDTVIVRIVGRNARGLEGTIERVVTRKTTRVAGILRRRGKSAWLEPDDTRVRGPIVLAKGMDLTDAEGNSGIDGMVAIVRIDRFPTLPDENPEGTLEAVLGMPGELSVEVRKTLAMGQIRELHDPEAVDEAEAYGETVPEAMLAGREDLTHLPLPTIDPEDARDHDDAVWVERTAEGGYRAWIAIADVSSYVRPSTKLDEEALARGCSVYLPDRAIPMLPRALSSNLCSLLPDVVRLCLAVEAELDSAGKVQRYRLVRGFMKSQAKLNYGGVARALGFTDAPPRQPQADAMVADLRTAYELSQLLRARRMKRGALDFDLPEAAIKLDEAGKPVSIEKRSSDPGVKKAYQLIEELMLLANELVAQFLVERSLPGIFRIHLPPDEQKLEKLGLMCQTLGVDFDVSDTQEPKSLATLLKRFAGHPNVHVLNGLLLRSMKQAVYDTANQGHFGLASQAYLHFTSPIRRYPDLVVHRIVHATLEADKRAFAAATENLQDLAIASSAAERRAMEVEREVCDVYRCFYMLDRLGERFEATVTAFVGSGAFMNLDSPFVDVLVRSEDLGPDIVIEDDGLSARGARSGERIILGDSSLVEVHDVAILRRTIYARRIASLEDDDGRRDGGRPGRRGAPQRGDSRRGEGGRGGERGAGDSSGQRGRTAKGKVSHATETADARGARRGAKSSAAGKAGRGGTKAKSPQTSKGPAKGPRKSGGKKRR